MKSLLSNLDPFAHVPTSCNPASQNRLIATKDTQADPGMGIVIVTSNNNNDDKFTAMRALILGGGDSQGAAPSRVLFGEKAIQG